VEVKRTADYIELYDEARSLTLRLYDGKIFWKTPDQNDWVPLSFAAIGKDE
jgi:hypothetical protein